MIHFQHQYSSPKCKQVKTNPCQNYHPIVNTTWFLKPDSNTIKSTAVVSLTLLQTPIQVPGGDGRASEMVPMLLPHEIIAATWRAGHVQDWMETEVPLFHCAI